MAYNEIQIDASPDQVFAVLADPRSYARWVVGSRRIRAADRGWPAAGTAFDHQVGIGPLRISDHSRVLICEAPHMLELLVQARPLSKALVTLRLSPGRGGTRLSMVERAADARSRILFNALTDPLVRGRNAESLRRLKALAEGREPMPDGPLPTRGSDAEGDIRASSAPAVR